MLSGHTALYWTMLLFWVFSHELENILSVILSDFLRRSKHTQYSLKAVLSDLDLYCIFTR